MTTLDFTTRFLSGAFCLFSFKVVFYFSSTFLDLLAQVFTFLSPGWEANKQNVVERAVSAVSHDIQRLDTFIHLHPF